MNSSRSFRGHAIQLAGMAVFVAVLVSPVWGQSTGSLVGTVRDASGGVVPEATVSLYRQGMTEPVLGTRTNGQGVFEFRALQPESYRIRVEAQGFNPYEPANTVTLAPGTETPLNDIVLTVGTVNTKIPVPAQVSVQTSDAQVSTNLTTEQLDTLPILDRNPLDLVLTQAGVVAAAGGFTTIDGLRTSFSNVTLDGINIQDNSLRYNGLDFDVNNLVLGQVSQFTLVTSNQAATYGNGTTQTAFVTPSGTNELHGSAFYQNSNNAMNANNWFQSAAGLNDAYKSNQAGFNVGGPLVKNKLFAYIGYEFLREPDSVGFASSVLPSGVAQQVAADYGATLNPVISGLLSQAPNTSLTRGLFLGTVKPGTVLPPPFILQGTNAFLPLGVLEHAESAQTDWDNSIAKLDYNPTKLNALVFSYLWNRDDSDSGPSPYGSRYAVTQHEKANLLSGSWRYMPNPHFTNELRAGADIYSTAFINREATTPYALDLGLLQDLNPVNTYQPQGRTVNAYDIQDNASYLLGKHDIQFGFQAQLLRDALYFQDNDPTVFFGTDTSKGCDEDLGDLLAGNVCLIVQHFYPVNSSGAFGNVPQQNYLNLNNYAAYAQDTWKVNRRLLLTAGLRYEHYSTLSDSRGLFYTPQLVNGSLAATFSAANPVYNPQGGGFYPAMNNVAPSIGLAFDPFGDNSSRSGRTVFRAAYGIAYVNDDFIEALRLALGQDEFSLGEVYATPKPKQTIPISPGILQEVDSIFTPPTGGPGYTAKGGGTVGLIDPGLRAPYVQQWSAGVQQAVGAFVFDIRYVGNHAVRLLRSNEFSIANNAGNDNTVYYTSNSSGSTYNALQFDVSRRLRRDLQFQANYTFSKALTDSNSVTSSLIDPYRDQLDYGLDKGPAVFDVRNAFKINLTYDLPFGRGRLSSMPLHSLLGGWSVSLIAVAQSGEPFSILDGDCQPLNPAGSSGSGCPTADASVGGAALSNVVRYQMTGNGPSIITSSGMAGGTFSAPAAGQPGTLGPRSFNGPHTFDLNLGIRKQFRITERQIFELRGVAINTLNHPSFGFNNQDITSSSFGLNAYAVYPARTVQLSAYYHF